MHPITMFLPWMAEQICLLAVGCIHMPWYASCCVNQVYKHVYLSLFLPCSVYSTKSVNLLSFAFLLWCCEHVLVVSSSSSVFMFCSALPVMLTIPFDAMKCSCSIHFCCLKLCIVNLFSAILCFSLSPRICYNLQSCLAIDLWVIWRCLGVLFCHV